MGGEIPTRDVQSFASGSFRGGIQAAIDRIGGLIEREAEDITASLDALEGRLMGYEDEQFKERKIELEIEAGRHKQLTTWLRPQLPSWQLHYYSLLVDLAKKNGLLDTDESIELDE